MVHQSRQVALYRWPAVLFFSHCGMVSLASSMLVLAGIELMY